MEKIVASQLTNAASLTGAISSEHFGCLPGLSADDAFVNLQSPAQGHLRSQPSWVPGAGMTKPLRLSILTNGVDGAFNCVVYRRLIQVLVAMKLPDYLSRWVLSTGTD